MEVGTKTTDASMDEWLQVRINAEPLPFQYNSVRLGGIMPLIASLPTGNCC